MKYWEGKIRERTMNINKFMSYEKINSSPDINIDFKSAKIEEIKRCVLNYYKLQAKKEKDMNIKVEKNNKEFKNVNDVNFGDTFWARTIEDEGRNDYDFLAMKVEIDCDLVGVLDIAENAVYTDIQNYKVIKLVNCSIVEDHEN